MAVNHVSQARLPELAELVVRHAIGHEPHAPTCGPQAVQVRQDAGVTPYEVGHPPAVACPQLLNRFRQREMLAHLVEEDLSPSSRATSQAVSSEPKRCCSANSSTQRKKAPCRSISVLSRSKRARRSTMTPQV